MEEEEKQDYRTHLIATINNLIDSGVSVYELDVVNKTAIRVNYREKIAKLEEENKNQKEALNQANKKILAQKGQLKVFNEKHFIPISVIQNKIDEKNRKINLLHTKLKELCETREKLGTETEIDNIEILIFELEEEKDEAYLERRILQELLEERNK